MKNKTWKIGNNMQTLTVSFPSKPFPIIFLSPFLHDKLTNCNALLAGKVDAEQNQSSKQKIYWLPTLNHDGNSPQWKLNTKQI